MARKCSICTHPRRADIEADILLDVLAREISHKYGVGWQAVYRHKAHMGGIPQSVVKAVRENRLPGQIVDADLSPLERLKRLYETTEILRNKAIERGDLRSAVATVHAECKVIEIEARFRGDFELERLQNTIQVALVQSPEWVQIREKLAKALEHHPEARQSVAAALEGIDRVGP